MTKLEEIDRALNENKEIVVVSRETSNDECKLINLINQKVVPTDLIVRSTFYHIAPSNGAVYSTERSLESFRESLIDSLRQFDPEIDLLDDIILKLYPSEIIAKAKIEHRLKMSGGDIINLSEFNKYHPGVTLSL